mmetsp:Transcript_13962/g.10068  ORF Transcript_13962/g.10068 Transcript_13962/m.10068 type:complete len:434 (+) Transcript_13962:395-1696(+)
MKMDVVSELCGPDQQGMYPSMLKLSPDNFFLIAYVNIDNFEKFYVYSTTKALCIWEGHLDLHGDRKELREDPEKLMFLSKDSLSVFARSENSKGVVQYALFDGQVISEADHLHTNYIYQIVASKDNNTLFTSSKDKKIKMWDWTEQTLIAPLIFHQDAVESIALSSDEKMLFSGSLDGQVGIWSVKFKFLITAIEFGNPIRTLRLSDGNEYLVCQVKSDKREKYLHYWQLEHNEDAFRINVNLKGTNNSYITPDNTYLCLLYQDRLDIWNIKSRTLIQTHKVQASFWLGIRTLGGTADANYVFFQQIPGDIVMWDCRNQTSAFTLSNKELLLDLVVASDDKFLYTNSEKAVYKWDIATRQMLCAFEHKERNFIYMVLSPDNSKIYSNCYGSFVYVLDLSKDENQEQQKFDIIKDSGWVLFEMAHDGEHFIQTS